MVVINLDESGVLILPILGYFLMFVVPRMRASCSFKRLRYLRRVLLIIVLRLIKSSWGQVARSPLLINSAINS